MDCAEFHRVLPEAVEGGRDVDFDVHVRSCPECAGLLAELDMIGKEAAKLREALVEPNPRVWNQIEIALRQEGIIREHQPEVPPAIPSRRWSMAWLIPVTATLLVVGMLGYQRLSSPAQAGDQMAAAPVAVSAVNAKTPLRRRAMPGMDDREFMALVASRPAPVRAKYEADLKSVNDYIRDAENSVESDPNDEMAQQYLMNAYQQKAVVYELALDRSMP
jgi:hypothetical protein